VPVFKVGVKKRKKEQGRRRKKEEERLRPERGAKSPSESAWGWGPKRSEKSVLPACTIRAVKECPLCGEVMRLKVRKVRDSVPGGGQGTVRELREWICPECDHFEEAEAGEGNS
jgi:hypothetical protein